MENELKILDISFDGDPNAAENRNTRSTRLSNLFVACLYQSNKKRVEILGVHAYVACDILQKYVYMAVSNGSLGYLKGGPHTIKHILIESTYNRGRFSPTRKMHMQNIPYSLRCLGVGGVGWDGT